MKAILDSAAAMKKNRALSKKILKMEKDKKALMKQIEELKIKALHLNDLRARIMNLEGLLKAVTGEDLPEILKKAEDNNTPP